MERLLANVKVLPEWFSPPRKAWDIVVAVIHIQVICETWSVILHVKLQKLKPDPLAQAHTDVPVADLFILILLREPGRLNDLFFISQNPTTFFGCKKTMRNKYIQLHIKVTTDNFWLTIKHFMHLCIITTWNASMFILNKYVSRF